MIRYLCVFVLSGVLVGLVAVSCSGGVNQQQEPSQNTESAGGEESSGTEPVGVSETNVEKPQESLGGELLVGPEEPQSSNPETAAESALDGSVQELQTEQNAEVTEVMVEQEIPDRSGPLTLFIVHANDLVTSYLMSGSAWNYFFGKTVPLGRHSNPEHTSYFTAFRFRQVSIPANATITSAYLSFYPHNAVDSSYRLMINIYAEKSADSGPYDPTNYTSNRPDQRSRTKSYIDRWIVRCNEDCSEDINSPKYEYDCPQRKKDCWNPQILYQVPKDLKALVQEVVSQPDWKSGHAMSLFLFNAATDQDGTKYQGSRTLLGYDENQKTLAPRLVISYQP